MIPLALFDDPLPEADAARLSLAPGAVLMRGLGRGVEILEAVESVMAQAPPRRFAAGRW
jgi:hypothetical protein